MCLFLDNIKGNMSDNQDYMEEEQYEYEEDPYSYEEDYGGQLYRNPSKDKNYDILELDDILKKIYEDNLSKLMLTYLPQDWNLMLYYFCDFSEPQLFQVIDQEQTGRKMIRFDQNYEPTIVKGGCMICCEETNLVRNACGHACCYTCWKDYLETSHKDRSIYELFPMCIWEGCYFRVNKLLMNKIWSVYPLEKRYFEKLLCLKYSRMSAKIKLCSKEGCTKAISINYGTERSLACSCGTKICRICGESDHYPLDCGDLKTWNQICSANQKQWLREIVTQPCPMCKTPIDKNGGCIHMTCRCGHSFCWICLKVWKGHNNYGSCNSIKKEDHEKKLMQEQEKRKKDEGFYNIRFEESKSEIERIENISKRLQKVDIQKTTQELNTCQILNKDVAWLAQIRYFIFDAMSLLQTANIYLFFQREGYQYLAEQLKVLWKMVSNLDDYLTDKSKSVSKSKKKLEEANEGLAVNGDILINEVKNNFFRDWEHSKELLSKARNIYDVVKEGKFMSIRI